MVIKNVMMEMLVGRVTPRLRLLTTCIIITCFHTCSLTFTRPQVSLKVFISPVWGAVAKRQNRVHSLLHPIWESTDNHLPKWIAAESAPGVEIEPLPRPLRLTALGQVFNWNLIVTVCGLWLLQTFCVYFYQSVPLLRLISLLLWVGFCSNLVKMLKLWSHLLYQKFHKNRFSVDVIMTSFLYF